MRLDFHASPSPTLGVEWEFALVDQTTRDLSNTAADLFAAASPRLPDPTRLHKELLRNTVEIVTGVCGTVGEAMADLRETLARGDAGGRRSSASTSSARARTPSPTGRTSSSPRATATPSSSTAPSGGGARCSSGACTCTSGCPSATG